MDKLHRITQLKRILTARRTPITLRQLMDRMECSESTARRTLHSYRDDFGAPLAFDRRSGGWYLNGPAPDPARLFFQLFSHRYERGAGAQDQPATTKTEHTREVDSSCRQGASFSCRLTDLGFGAQLWGAADTESLHSVQNAAAGSVATRVRKPGDEIGAHRLTL